MLNDNPLNPNSDEYIIKKLLSSDSTELFSIIYQRYFIKIKNKVCSIIKNRNHVADIVQEIFIKVFSNLNNFKYTSSFSTWVYAITLNECMEYLRKTKKTMIFSELDDEKDYPTYFDAPKELNEDRDYINYESLELLINELSTQDKELIKMKYERRLSIKQIQDIMNLSESAVKMRLNRVKGKLYMMHTKTERPKKYQIKRNKLSILAV